MHEPTFPLSEAEAAEFAAAMDLHPQPPTLTEIAEDMRRAAMHAELAESVDELRDIVVRVARALEAVVRSEIP